MASRRVWCEYAALPDGVLAGVLISIDEGLIADIHVGPDSVPADAEQLCGLTLPGFANAHSHAFHRALRGRTHRGRGDFWTWREQMYRVAGKLTPENYLALARATFAEMLLAGFTCVGEFHYVHHAPGGEPYAEPNAMGHAIVQAARETGIRLTLLDACYLRGGAGRPLLREQLRFTDGSAARWAARVDALADAPLVRIGAAVHSVRAVDAPSIATVAKYAAGRSMPLHAHVSEQPAENEQVAMEFGCSPTEILARQGALSSRFTAVHATHLIPTDIELYARAGCTCCFCPTTERDLADGVGPSAELRAGGVRLAIGSDQHAVIDPFEEMRGIELDERLRSMRRGTHPARGLIDAGTANGYRSLGWHNGGRLAVGSLADLTTVSLDSVRLAGAPLDGLLEAVVFAASTGDVSTVIVAGTTVVDHRVHVDIDTVGELRTSISALLEGK